MKPVTDNQVREVARLARNLGVSRADFQSALTNGVVNNFLLTLVPSEVVYPDWVVRHETLDFASKKVVSPGVVNLWLTERQERGNPYPTGHEVYEEIKKNNFLKTSLSLGHLQWYTQNPDKIPKEFEGKLIYAWADVVRDADGSLSVPWLNCGVPQPYVDWCWWLHHKWGDREPAGLHRGGPKPLRPYP